MTIAFRGPTFMNVCGCPLGSTSTATISSSSASALRLTPSRNSRAGAAHATRARELDAGALDEQRRSASPAGDAVPRFPPIVPRLRICGEPTVRDASASAGRALGERALHRLGVGQARAEPQRPVLARPAAELRDLVEVEDGLRARAIEVQRDHHVGPALDRHGVRVLGLERERLVERAGVRTSTGPFYLSSRTYGTPSAAERRAVASRSGRDEHEHDDRHHVRQGVQELGRHVDVTRACRRTGARTGSEEVGADEAEPARQKAKITSAMAIQPAPPTSVSPAVQPGVIERL